MYNLYMLIEFDAAKNDRNITERGLSFQRASEFDFSSAIVEVDDRKVYPEMRYVAVAILTSACTCSASLPSMVAFV